MPRYRIVPDYPEYRVGDDGSVWSRYSSRGSRGCKLTNKWKQLNPTRTQGRLVVTLCSNGNRRRWYVHQLVVLVFCGPCPVGQEVCHADGDNLNCRLSNLKYDTHKGNMVDQFRHGTRNRGERRGLSKLTVKDVREIRKLAGTMTQQAIADKFGVVVMTVNCVLLGKTWSWLE